MYSCATNNKVIYDVHPRINDYLTLKNQSKIKEIHLVLIVFLTLSIFSTGTNLMLIETHAQIGSMATLHNTPSTFAVSIVPGAAQRESPYHFYPPVINVPVGTTVGWFNNDFDQPHTVTSGVPNASDAGSTFNSGLMPPTANSFFQYTFNNSGDYIYHYIIHPWRQAWCQ